VNSSATTQVSRSGLTFALSAYVLWGFLPILFVSIEGSTAPEIVAWRIVLSLIFCGFLLTVTRGWRRLIAVLGNRSAMGTLAIASVIILVNWLVFIYATQTDHVVEAALGYFTTPIVTVLLGVLFLRERLRPIQWVAIGISAVAVLVLAIGYGAFPWLALALAFSFGFYGLVKKRVGVTVDAIAGLTVETAVLTPLAAVTLVALGMTGGLAMGNHGLGQVVLMLSLGVATATPLILFAAAARRLPLVYLGLVQFLSPILILIVGVFILHEAMPLERWIGFGIVWVALTLLTWDMVRHESRQRQLIVSGGL
jgi:chloramphenicol-sensitive protein RarD